MQRFITIITMLFITGAALYAQAGGGKRYVAVQAAGLKDSTGFFAKDVGTLQLGTEVTLVREDGKWAEVRAGNLGGWVAASSLSARRVVAAAATVTASEVALAGKGFSPAAEAEYRKNGLDYSTVDSMEQIRVPSGELLRFITEGRLERGE